MTARDARTWAMITILTAAAIFFGGCLALNCTPPQAKTAEQLSEVVSDTACSIAEAQPADPTTIAIVCGADKATHLIFGRRVWAAIVDGGSVDASDALDAAGE